MGRNVRSDRWLRASGLRDRQLDDRRGPRGLRARRGRRGHRAARPRARPNSWEERGGQFTEGTALEIDALLAAGIERADAFVASTDGDNTNLVIAQIAKRRFDVDRVVVRVLDPARARWYAEQGLQTVCPTQTAIELLEAAVRGPDPLRGSGGLAMYVVIVGAGKVGWNLARELINKRHEVTVIESDPHRYAVVEEELEHSAHVRRRLGAVGARARRHRARRPGGRRDRRRRGQHPDLARSRARSTASRAWWRAATTRATSSTSSCWACKPAISATDLILRLIEHEVPKYGLVHLLDLPEERLEIIELEVARRARRPPGAQVKDLGLPDGSLVISILREGGGFVPTGDSVIEAGDEVLLVLDVGIESRVTELLHRAHGRLAYVARRQVDYLLIGGGLAAANCARWLREEGARRARSCWSGREPDPPYNRPPLSKGYLQGKESREDVLFRPDEWWDEQRHRAADAHERDEARHRRERVATLSTKDEVEFGKALLATGANVRRLRVDGCDLDGIHYLRAFGNSDAIQRRRRAAPSARC